MSIQGEVKLVKHDAEGRIVPFVCEHCGRQRIGVILNIITKTMLPCICKKAMP